MLLDKGLRRKSARAADTILSLDSMDGWELSADNISLSRDKAMKVSTVNRCVEVLSSSVAMLPVYLMNEKTKERLPDHRLGRMLWGRANEAMATYDYERLMECNRLLKGNAYAWIHRDPKTGYPVELIPLQPDHVTIHVDRDGRLWYVYLNPRTGELTRLDPLDILHYKAYSTDGIEGISVLKRAALTVSTGLAAQQYQSSLYQNGGRPSGLLTVETDLGGKTEVTDSAGNKSEITMKEYVRREWERIHAGPTGAFRVAVLDHGMKYQPISMSNSDAQFVQSEEIRVADVCRFFGVPLHLVYAGKQSYDSNEQNSLEFTRYTLQPTVTEREQEDSYKLLLPSERTSGMRIRRELKVFLRGDSAAQAAWYKTMIESGPYSVNDVRALEDLPAVPGGDARRASLNYVPLEDWQELSRQRAGQGNGGESNG